MKQRLNFIGGHYMSTNEGMIEHQHSMQPIKKAAAIQTTFAKIISGVGKRHMMLRCIEDRLQLKGMPLTMAQYNELAELFAVVQ